MRPYIKIPNEHLLEEQRASSNLLKFKGTAESFGKRFTIQKCETQGFDSVVQAMEEAGGKKRQQAGGVNKNMLAHYGALYKNGMQDIAIKDVPKEDTILLLNYMYKGKMEINSKEILRKAVLHAVRFKMGSLIDGIADEYDFQQNSLVILYQLGDEFGIQRFKSKAIKSLCGCFCSPKFPLSLLRGLPIRLIEDVLKSDGILAESEGEIANTLMGYLKLADVASNDACRLLNILRFPFLSLAEIVKIDILLAQSNLNAEAVPNLNRLKMTKNVLSAQFPKEQITTRSSVQKGAMLWIEKRHQEDHSVVILNVAALTKQEKAHAYAKLKLKSIEYDKQESPENFDMVTIGDKMFVNVKDNEFPSMNIFIQLFVISEKNDLVRVKNGRIPFNFKQEVTNKRLSSDGSKLFLSFNLIEKKKKKRFRFGYFNTVPQLDRTFNEIELPAEINNAVFATVSRSGVIFVLTKISLIIIDGNRAETHFVSEGDFEVECVDMILKNDVVLIYAFCYKDNGNIYKQVDLIRSFDIRLNKFVGSCKLPEISQLFENQYSGRFKRGQSRQWTPRGSNSTILAKFDESLFRFFDVGKLVQFVWIDDFNQSGRIFHFGIINLNPLKALVLRKVFYSKSDDNGNLILSRQLLGIVPGYLVTTKENTWLENKINESSKGLTTETIESFHNLLNYV